MRKRVLVIEDDPEIRRLVGAVLSTNGYSVDEADGGRAGLQKIGAEVYDAIVLDLMMPDVSGHEVLRAIHKLTPGSKRVVVLSAAALQEMEKVDPSVVRAKLRKPFDISELLDAVKLCADSAS
jgi:DNA-binding response OmpR family regulator